MKIGFDNDRYLKMQSEHIKERIAKFGDKLYLEFGAGTRPAAAARPRHRLSPGPPESCSSRCRRR